MSYCRRRHRWPDYPAAASTVQYVRTVAPYIDMHKDVLGKIKKMGITEEGSDAISSDKSN